MIDELIARLGLALAIGLLVGLERGWRERNAPEHSRTAGIRTFGISGLLGGVFAALAQMADAWAVLAVGFTGFAAVFAWYASREAIADQDFSVTGVIAGMCVFGLGALAVVGDYTAAAAGGAALAAILASREILHELLKRLSWEEVRAALILAVMTAIVLPLLPNRTIDPWGGLNPWEIWFFTVLVAALSYLGYAAVRVLGEARGLLVSSLAGAVVSSTAVTVALARRSKTSTSFRPLAGAAALAAAVSITRVCVIVAIVGPEVLPLIAAPALAGVAVFATGGALLLLRNDTGAADGVELKNPFDLGPLLVFALLFAVISTASAILTDFIGQSGMIATSAVSGTFDVDVAVLSALRNAVPGGALSAIGLAILLALAANAGGRLSLALLAGTPRFGATYALISLAAGAAGAGAYLLMRS